MISSKNNKENIIYYKDILKIRDIKRYNGSYDNCSLYKSSISSSKNIFSMSSLHKKDNENNQNNNENKKWPLSKGNTSRSGLDSINENSSSIGDYQFNIAFIGDSNVGKSELLQKECRIDQNDNLSKNQKIIKFYKKAYTLNDRACIVTYWDTPGDNEYLVDTIHLCSNMAGVVFIYDGTNINSFVSLKNWINEYEKNNSNNTNVFKVILCNLKTFGDTRNVQYNEGYKLAKSIQAEYLEYHEEVSEQAINYLFSQIIFGVVQDIPLKFENNQFILVKHHISLLKKREYYEQVQYFMNNKYQNINKKDCTTVPDWINSS
jgi:GTPase SAR1 family protein